MKWRACKTYKDQIFEMEDQDHPEDNEPRKKHLHQQHDNDTTIYLQTTDAIAKNRCIFNGEGKRLIHSIFLSSGLFRIAVDLA